MPGTQGYGLQPYGLAPFGDPAPTPSTDTVLMGWRGYYIFRSGMIECDDRTVVFPIPTQTPILSLTDDLNAQRNRDYYAPGLGMLQLAEYSLGDNPEAVNYAPGVLMGWDTDADQQLSNAIEYSKLLDPTDNTLRIFIPITEIDNDTEYQLSNAADYSRLLDPEDRTILIFIPRVGIDNDSDNQIPSPTLASNIASDSGQDATQLIILPIIADQFDLNQFSINLNTAFAHSDIGQEWTQLIIVPSFNPAFVPQIEEQQSLSTELRISLLIEEEKSTFISPPPGATDLILMAYSGYRVKPAATYDTSEWTNLLPTPIFNPANVPQVDEQQISSQKYYFDEQNQEILRIILPPNNWDTDGDNQKVQPDYFKDHLADEGIELIIPPFNIWDNDGENQKIIPEYYKDHLSDEGIEIILLPFNDWTLDSDLQLPLKSNFTDHLSDENVEKITLNPAITSLFSFDNDAENQKPSQVSFSCDTLSDEGVEQIILNPAITRMFGFDTDAEQQLSNSSNYSTYQDPEDRQILVPTPPGCARDIILMGWKGYKIPTSAMAEYEAWTQLIILAPSVISLKAFDNDAEWQIPSQVGFSSDTVSDEEVEKLTLAPGPTQMTFYDSDAFGMINTQIQFTSADQGHTESTNFIILVPFVDVIEIVEEGENE